MSIRVDPDKSESITPDMEGLDFSPVNKQSDVSADNSVRMLMQTTDGKAPMEDQEDLFRVINSAMD